MRVPGWLTNRGMTPYWRILTLILAIGLGLLAGRVLYTVRESLASAERMLLDHGDRLPDIELVDLSLDHRSLAEVVLTDRPNFLLILSTSCQSYLGELVSWQDAMLADSRLRPLVVVETDDAEYLERTTILVTPSYDLHRIDEDAMKELGVFATPTAYWVDEAGRVVASAIGVQAILDMRRRWQNET